MNHHPCSSSTYPYLLLCAARTARHLGRAPWDFVSTNQPCQPAKRLCARSIAGGRIPRSWPKLFDKPGKNFYTRWLDTHCTRNQRKEVPKEGGGGHTSLPDPE